MPLNVLYFSSLQPEHDYSITHSEIHVLLYLEHLILAAHITYKM
jgi:hypothetical protein